MEIAISEEKIVWGSTNKTLFEWITEVDLEKWNIMVKDPIAVRNFLTQYTDYTSDMEQFGMNEYWQNPNTILHTRNDDCEGINNLACNILFTLGYDCRLAIGRLDTYNSTKKPEEWSYNHAYGLLFEDEYDTNPSIIECTGNHLVEELRKIDDHQEYYTWYMGSAVHEQDYICGHLIEQGE